LTGPSQHQQRADQDQHGPAAHGRDNFNRAAETGQINRLTDLSNFYFDRIAARRFRPVLGHGQISPRTSIQQARANLCIA